MIIDNPSPRHIPALRRIWKQAFGDSEEFLDCFFEIGFAYDRCRCVLLENEPAAVVYFFDCRWQDKKIAYLYALAVDEAHQKQGLSRLLLSDTHAHLQRSSYAGAIMEPASESLMEYYERLGYCRFGGRTEQVYEAGESPTDAVKLGDLGYEQARDVLLPPDAIRQEGAFTAMLHTQAEFYAGEDFVAAVSKESPMIYEFLGNTEQLPGLIRLLNLEKATVRLPGGQPTAVYLSFSGEEIPTFFGLPLD